MGRVPAQTTHTYIQTTTTACTHTTTTAPPYTHSFHSANVPHTMHRLTFHPLLPMASNRTRHASFAFAPTTALPNATSGPCLSFITRRATATCNLESPHRHSIPSVAAAPTPINTTTARIQPSYDPIPTQHSRFSTGNRHQSSTSKRPSPIASTISNRSNSEDIEEDDRDDSDDNDYDDAPDAIRINKCFKSFASRRQSDIFIRERRVTINDTIAEPGARVRPTDVVCLDGRPIPWQRLALPKPVSSDNSDIGEGVESREELDTTPFVYLKHWKRPGVVCTTKPTVEGNIIAQLPAEHRRGTEDALLGKGEVNDIESGEGRGDRVFPIGRLDEASSGVILLTSDGRLPNAVLGKHSQCEKTYVVKSDLYVNDKDLSQLRRGVKIRTDVRRPGRKHSSPNKPTVGAPSAKSAVYRTLPCKVERGEDRLLVMTLREGRNRQIRKMLGSLGYSTRMIHRIDFMGISLKGLSGPGDTCELSEEEMLLVKERLRQGSSS